MVHLGLNAQPSGKLGFGDNLFDVNSEVGNVPLISKGLRIHGQYEARSTSDETNPRKIF